ncbi:heme peroxidase [Melampsora americana]|nr:heme peroxidase [Melampsora americana]
MSHQSTTNRPYHSLHASQPKTGEALVQTRGYTHLSQIGPATDLPTSSDSGLWRRVAQFQETAGIVSHYLFSKGGQYGHLDNYEESAVTDDKRSTSLAYLALQQTLAGLVPANLAMVANLLTSVGKPLDDRKLQLEEVVAFLSRAGKKRHTAPNKLVDAVQSQFITLLWNDLSHPPTVDLNPKHRFRKADGSDNNLTGDPLLGAANQPYSRSVRPVHPVPAHIAEPEDMFDAILRRPTGYEGFVPHPAHVSSLFFGFANIVIHDIFWTNNREEVKVPSKYHESGQDAEKGDAKNKKSSPWQNLTSSYASLDPLYGVSDKAQATIRDREQLGRGLLYNDTFASDRLLMMPPASCALLVLFSRNHNRIAKKLLELNERGNWKSDLSKLSEEELQEQDDEIFGTARHVNCGYYAGIILGDYLQAILNTTQADSDWSLNPRLPIKSIIGTTPKATGNSASVEFNTLYRWHAPISWSQTQWLESTFEKALPSRKWEEMDFSTLLKAIGILKNKLNADDKNADNPKVWKLSKREVRIPEVGPPVVESEGVYERDSESGKFRDEDLARILKDSTYEVAGAFGARHVPAVMRWIECQGMRTARDVWKLCTLNEFRAFIGLKEFETFQEWNSDPEIASAMEDLVGHPANIPLHVGLHGEEAKKPRLGSGVCLPYTISRAILSDAIALVRGDRFYTDNATADVMTNWGLADCQPDPQNGSLGGMLEKLIRENLPNQYAFNDCALLFPFIIPRHSYSVMQQISHQKALNYEIDPPIQPIIGYQQIHSGERTLVHELSDTPKVESQRMGMIVGLDHMNSNIKLVYKAVEQVMYHQDVKQYHDFIQSRIQACSSKRSPVSADETVDVLRDVANPLVSGWLAHVFGLIETGIHSQQLLLSALSDIYYYLTESPQISFKARTAARVAASGLTWQIKSHIQGCTPSQTVGGTIKKGASMVMMGALGALEETVKFVSSQDPGFKGGHGDTLAFYSTLTAENNAQVNPLSPDELAADCLRAISTLAFTIVNGTAYALDYLLPEVTKPDEVPRLRETLEEIVTGNDQVELREAISRHALEATRLGHWNESLRGMVFKTEDQNRTSRSQPIGIIDTDFRLDRGTSSYLRLLDVEGYCLSVFEHIVPIVISQILSLSQVRRAPGGQGKLGKLGIKGSISSIPTMHIRYDGTKSQ